ncbi:MAG: pantoate--beta-alanine ligase [Candidatus Omnitrophota bacterium]|nr:pantoate--beta-alanine ligase [Candidatus Omnitrophota bacterium]
MKMIKKIAALKKEIKALRQKHKTIGFVPTMGALHAGHVKLIRCARKQNSIVIVSIFVNPAQFGPAEDFKKYPRTLLNDAAVCRKEGVDIIFSPSVAQMYPSVRGTYVTVEGLSNVLCGAGRPGHFRGVATVVTKLMNIVEPDTMYLGQKDAQQAAVVKRMARDLFISGKIRVIPTVRQKNGLALSSRNAYLSEKEKNDAASLYQSLMLAQKLVKSGLNDAGLIIRRMKGLLAKFKSVKIDYVSVLDAQTFIPLKKAKRGCLVALAARVGKTRLIDNIVIPKSSL